jgi:hypothetical protein
MQPLSGLEFVQYGIKRSRANVVSVTGEFLNHFKAEYGPLAGMVQDMQSDQAGIESLVFIPSKLSAFVFQKLANAPRHN